MITRRDCEALDAADVLAHCRDRFDLPGGVIYLDGNSLGALPRSTRARLDHVIGHEWGSRLIRSWNESGWMELTAEVGIRLGRLLGCAAHEVVAVESTTMALYKTIGAALRLAPHGRRRVVTEVGNFPTDAHVLAAMAGTGAVEVVAVDARDIVATLDESVALVVLTHVNYRSGEMHDMAAITAAAQNAGALVMWDLSHSTGAVPLELAADGVDFAVGCGYKYLNGGPGASAFVFAAARHHSLMSNPLPGWLGHRDPFAMSEQHDPAPGMGQFVSGTPNVLSLVGLDEGLATFDGVTMADLRVKSLALTGLFIDLADQRLTQFGVTVGTTRDSARRGSQVALHHQSADGLSRALTAREVIGDFRPPDIARFGFAPLYNRFTDAWDAVQHMVDALSAGEHLT